MRPLSLTPYWVRLLPYMGLSDSVLTITGILVDRAEIWHASRCYNVAIR